MNQPIYLDNAATTFPKPEPVYAAVEEAMRGVGASPGRGGYRQSLSAGRVLFEARESLAAFFGISDSSHIVFTSNATQAINQGLFGILKPGDRVVTTSMEHNAVTRPLRALEERKVTVHKVQGDDRGFIDPLKIRQACSEKTRLVIMGHCSNVTGTLQAIEEIGPWCQKQGILFMVDGAQSAGCFAIHAEAMGIDLLAVPGHKGLLGPQGTGALYVRPGLCLEPMIYGGTGNSSSSQLPPAELPERLEAGTHNFPAIAGLKAGVDFVQAQGLKTLKKRKTQQIACLIEGLSSLPGIEVHGPLDPQLHGGAISFTHRDLDPSEIGFILDREHEISVRVGLHCAPDAHRTIGTFPRGTVRVSPGIFTTDKEIETFLEAMGDLISRETVL